MGYKGLLTAGVLFFLLQASGLGAQISVGGLGPGPGSDPGKVQVEHHLEIREFDPAARRFDLALVLDLKPGYHAVLQKDFLWLKLVPTAGITAAATMYSRADLKVLEAPAYGKTATLSLPLTLDESTWKAMENQGISLPVSWSWQICDDAGQCFVPRVTRVNASFRGNPPELAVVETGGSQGLSSSAGSLDGALENAGKTPESGPAVAPAKPGEAPGPDSAGSSGAGTAGADTSASSGSGLPGADTAASPGYALPGAASAPDAGSVVLMLLFAFLGGLILNLMPCVLPVLSLKVLALVESRDEQTGPRHEARTGRLLHGHVGLARLKALASSAGMVGSVLALGVVVLALRAGGQAAGWGFQFQNPHFVLVLIMVVLALGLSMLGVWQFRLPVRQPRAIEAGSTWGTWKSPEPASNEPVDDQVAATPRKSRGLIKAVADGVLMVVLATPCSAPFLGSAMGFALSAPPLLALATFLFLGLGLALPFFLLAWFPVLRAFIPRPGPWMDTLKTVLAFFLFGTVAWLAGISLSQIGAGHAGSLLGLVTAVAFAFWAWGQSQLRSGIKAWLFRIAALLVLLAGLVLLYPWTAGATARAGLPGTAGTANTGSFGSPGSNAPGTVANPGAATVPGATGIPARIALVRGGVDWRVFSPEAVAAAQASGSPVFIDFGASWCLTCGVNEKGILSDPDALKGLASLGTIFFQGDFTLADPAILSWMQDWGRAAVPFYQVLRPDGSGQVLPELLGRADLDQAAAWLGASKP